MKSKQFLLGLVAAGTLGVAAPAAVWGPTAGGTYSWDANANWNGGGGPYPNGAGAVANLNLDYTGDQIVNLNQQITVGELDLGDAGTPGSSDNVITIQPGTAGSLVFANGGSNAKLKALPESQNKHTTITANITLNNNLDITFAGQNDGRLILNGSISGAGKTITIATTYPTGSGGDAGIAFGGAGNSFSALILTATDNKGVQVNSGLGGAQPVVTLNPNSAWKNPSGAIVPELRGNGSVQVGWGGGVSLSMGTVAGAKSYNLTTDGVIAPSNGTTGPIGTLTLSDINTDPSSPGNLLSAAFTAGQLQIDIASAASFDALNFRTSSTNPLNNSDVTINGSTLALNLSYAATIGQTFKIIDVDGAKPVTVLGGGFSSGSQITTTFAGVPYTFNILYNSALGGGTGNDVVLQLFAIPEPATLGLLGLSGLMLVRRRRTCPRRLLLN